MSLFARIRKAFAGSPKPEQLVRERYADFQHLLEGNDKALEQMGSLSELLERQQPFAHPTAARLVGEALEGASQMVASLIRLSNGRYGSLRERLEAIGEGARAALARPVRGPVDEAPGREPEPVPYSLPLDDVDLRHRDLVGAKMAVLGELRNVVGAPVPDGFCLTRRCAEETLAGMPSAGELARLVEQLDPRNGVSLHATCARIQELILAAPVPDVVAAAMLAAYDALVERGGRVGWVVVRASAQALDERDHAFAGLHHGAIEVGRDGLLAEFRRVLASKWSAESVAYRFLHGLADEHVVLGVGCMQMVDARASGTVFTEDPGGRGGCMVVDAVLGSSAILREARVVPQRAVLREERGVMEVSSGGNQEYALFLAPGGTLEPVPVLDAGRRSPWLGPDEARCLAMLARTTATHLGAPQEVEWAATPGGIVILQVRPLALDRAPTVQGPAPAGGGGERVLVSGGEVACGGASCGPVFVASSDRVLAAFPAGGVLVIRKTSPAFAEVLHRAAGVIADVGNSSGHLAIVARDLGVPMLINVPEASKKLSPGSLVTVDGARGRVLAGRVDRLLAQARRKPAGPFVGSPVHRAATAAAASVIPLGLIDPHDAGFAPQGCRTVHDVTRFCHETAIREMFDVAGGGQRRMTRAHKLAVKIPLETFVIDLGGGLATGAPDQVVRPEDVRSVPFQALIEGMSTPGLKWSGAVPIELRGFASLVLNTMMDTERATAELGSDAYALVSQHYVNYSARMGYHFASLDAYASPMTNRNYVSYRFKGGAAASERRERRAKFIAHVLRRWGFSVVQRGDHVGGTIRKLSEPDTLALLRELGRLLGAVRNADVTMYSDEQIELYAEAFLAGACSPVDATQGKLRSS